MREFRGCAQQSELSSAEVRVDLDHTCRGTFHSASDAGELRFLRAKTRRGTAIGGTVLGCARCAESECAGRQGFLEELTHSRYLVFRWAFPVIRPAIAHH